MKIFRRYLKDHLKLLLAILVLLGTAAFLFYLYDLPLGAVLYTAALSGTILLIFFVLPDCVSYWRRAKLLEELRENILTTLECPTLSGGLQEELLLNISKELCGRVQDLEAAHSRQYADMLEYYTLWVHQIKTPLSAMRLILQSEPTQAGEALRQELFKVERYVEMVLGYLRLDTMSSDLRLERYRVHDIVRQAVKKFAPQFIYQKLTMDLREFGNEVITDEKWLLFVLEQLLSNALKYTKQGGVTIFMDENDTLTLRDTGTGIAQEDLPRIFERGFTGYNGRLNKTASGLGLYLTKQILDRLQNRIEIDSQLGTGTEVRLYLHRSSLPGD